MSCFAWYHAPKTITRSMKRWKIRFWCFCRHLRWTNMYGPPEWCNRSTKRCALWKRNQKRQHTTFHRLEVFPAASVQTVLYSLQPCWAFWPDSKMKAGVFHFHKIPILLLQSPGLWLKTPAWPTTAWHQVLEGSGCWKLCKDLRFWGTTPAALASWSPIQSMIFDISENPRYIWDILGQARCMLGVNATLENLGLSVGSFSSLTFQRHQRASQGVILFFIRCRCLFVPGTHTLGTNTTENHRKPWSWRCKVGQRGLLVRFCGLLGPTPKDFIQMCKYILSMRKKLIYCTILYLL